MLVLAIARQYLGTVQSPGNKVHLIRWEDGTRLIWFKEMIPVRDYPHAYYELIRHHQTVLADLGVRVRPGAFFRLAQTNKEYAEIDVGFQYIAGAQIPPAIIQVFPRTLFLTIVHDDDSRHSILTNVLTFKQLEGLGFIV